MGAVFLSANKKKAITENLESALVKYNLKDLPEHGITLIAPSDPALSRNLETIDPYSVFLRSANSKAIVGYSIKWDCFDGKNESADRDMSFDYRRTNILGVVFLYGEQAERRNLLSRLEGVIEPNSTWLISYSFPARPIGTAVEEASSGFTETALAEIRRVCPVMTVTVDGVFFDDGTFVGPDTTVFFARVETEMAMRHEVLQKVQSELKSGKTPTDVFHGLERIVNSVGWTTRTEDGNG